MEIIKGKIVSGSEQTAEQVREIEYFTDPVPVRRHKLSFGAVGLVQMLLSVLLGVFLWWARDSGGEAAELANEFVRRLING